MSVIRKAGGTGKIKQALNLAKEYIGEKAQKEIEDDYAAWCVFVKGYDPKKKTPVKYVGEYMKKVYFNKDVGVAGWRPKK